jgi:hypothetical protein
LNTFNYFWYYIIFNPEKLGSPLIVVSAPLGLTNHIGLFAKVA